MIILSSHECNALVPVFRSSKNACLYMYRARLSQFHRNLLHNNRLCVTGMYQKEIDLKDEAQLNMFAGAQNFGSQQEQDAYCRYMGLIPQPRTTPFLRLAFDNGYIKPNGFVPSECRRLHNEIFQCVGQCTFQQNPIPLAIAIITARHETIRIKSHAAYILQSGTKATIHRQH